MIHIGSVCLNEIPEDVMDLTNQRNGLLFENRNLTNKVKTITLIFCASGAVAALILAYYIYENKTKENNKVEE